MNVLREDVRVDGESPEVFRMFDLQDRVAIVTGASSGLGEHVSRVLAGAGARVAVLARREDRLRALAKEIDGLAVSCDLLQLDRIGGVVDQVAMDLGRPEILVNAAGHFLSEGRAEEEPADAVRATLDLNLVAPFRLCQEVYPHMVEVGRGSIVNIASISGHVGVPSIPQASYAAAKIGLSGMTRELAVQWSRDSIRINTIAPGFFRSEITNELYESERGDAWLRRNTLLPYHGTVEDFGGAVLWLASDAGRYVTGQTIVIDGGWTAH
jgi:NAD(P)-dependent dehydrogenase (short-subunit alcohol dehydrogenase family)